MIDDTQKVFFMYLLTSNPKFALDIWETTGIKVYLWDTPDNQWFQDETFERIKTIEEFCEQVKQDFALWEGDRQQPQENWNEDMEGNFALYNVK